ncbi:MAG: hypothetical protein WD740_02650 [Anaerolineales bacterium]
MEPKGQDKPRFTLPKNINLAVLQEPRNLTIAAFVAGLIIGLVLLGWWLFPVNWENASPAELSPAARADYLRAALDSYTLAANNPLARARLAALGDSVDETMATVASAPGQQSVDSIARFQALLGVTAAEPTTGTPPVEGEDSLFSTGSLLTTLCGITLFIGLALGVIYIVRSRQGDEIAGDKLKTRHKVKLSAVPEPDVGADSPPLSQWMTNYIQGDDLYDDSYSIDSPAGEFMGECGVSIAETIGVGNPKRVSAFEIWLFDKNDIQTVTKVLMSSHLFRDDAGRERLSAKGEPVLAGPGVETVLETATLQMVARVVDMQYGEGPMPEESFFERVTLELAVWSKV